MMNVHWENFFDHRSQHLGHRYIPFHCSSHHWGNNAKKSPALVVLSNQNIDVSHLTLKFTMICQIRLLPTLSFKTFVIMPLRPSANEIDKFA